jgi:hypothetical protein
MNGLDALSEHVDTLIAIPNQKLMHIVEPGTSFSDALLMADEVLFQATRGISDLIMGHGIINLDFADVRTVMRDRGNALLGSGTASGKDRAVEAAQAAVSSPLLEEISIEGAEALLVNIQGGTSMSFHEAAEAAQFIADRVGDEADVFWGAVVDPAMDEEVRVTLIATGFPGARRLGEANQVLSGAAPASRATVAGREARGGDLRKIAHRRGAERYESIEINLASGPASSREEGHAHPTDPERPAVADRSVAAGGSAITRRSSVADGPNESLGFVGGRGERSPERDGRPLMDRESNRGHEAALGGRSEPNLGSSAHPGGAPRKPEEPDGERSSRADESRRGPDVERGHDAESGQPAGRGREAARTPERVQEAARGQETDREDRRGQVPGRAPAGAPDRVRPAQVEPVHAAESARRRIEELVPLRGADEGLRGGRGYDSSWNREQQEKRKNGNRREERGSHRNPLDVPTYLRKPVDD